MVVSAAVSQQDRPGFKYVCQMGPSFWVRLIGNELAVGGNGSLSLCISPVVDL